MNRRFRLERKLGEGGMGAVWLARDEVSGEPLALKMLAADRIGGEAALAHFKREFAALAALSHPNLAKVFDFGAIESIEPGPRPPGPAFFFTSEYVEGQDLFRAALPLSYMEICDIAVEVLRALSYIHARGFIHHDVKPSNILVTSGGGVKLLDFGLVGSKSAAPQGIKGTLRYLAPEVVRGAPIDERADLHSLGVTLYEVVTRRLPFDGESTLSVIRKIVEGAPEPPRAIRKDLPPALEEFIMRLLAKEPADRYASADDAIEALAAATGRPYRRETRETLEARVLSGRFVGRESALARLREAPEKEPFLLVTGEQGIGRSRLLRELKHALQLDGRTAIAARAAGGPWAPWPEVLRQARALAEGKDLDRLRRLLGALSPADSGPPRESQAGSEGDERRTLIDSIAAVLTDLARKRPLVLLLDDLGDADRNALEVAAVIARGERERPSGLSVVAAARTDAGLPGPLAALLAEGAASELALPRLTPDEVASLVASMTGAGAAFARRVAAETGGNPFFVEQVMKAVAEAPGAPPGGETELPLPPTLADALRRRVEAAREPERRALEALAIFGSPAPAETLAALLGEPVGEVHWRLRALERRGLAAREGTGTEEALRFQPSSARLRDIVRAAIPPERERSLREAAVRVLEEGLRSTGETRAPLETLEALAEHARAVGDSARAVRYAMAAALSARAVHANEKAVACYSVAIDELTHSRLDPSIRDSQFSILNSALQGRCEADLALGRNDSALRDATRAIELCAAAGAPAPPALFAAAGRALAALGDAAGARERFERALGAAEAAGDRAAAADALREIGNVEFSQGRYEEALARYAEARRTVPAGQEDAALLARLFRDEANCLLEKGDYERGLASAREALEIERRRGDEGGIARSLRGLAQLLYYRGSFDEALEVAREAVVKSERVGFAPGIAASRNLIGHVLHARGRTQEAREHYESALRIWRRIGDRAGEAAVLNNLGCIAESLCELEAALARYTEAAGAFEAIGYRGAVALAFGNLASVHAALGRLEEADALAAKALGLSSNVGNRRIEIEAKRIRAEVRLRRGELRAAREAAQEATKEARALGNRPCLAGALRALGGAALALGRPREARESLEEALALAGDLGDRALGARARVDLARLATAEGRFGRAHDLLDQAREAARAGDRLVEVEALLAAAALARESSDLERALDAAGQARERARAHGIGALRAEAAVELAEVEIARGQAAAARAAIEEAREHAGRCGQAIAAARAEAAAAHAALFEGDAAAAAASAALAAEQARERGAAPVEAQARLVAAEAARARGELDLALAAAERALRIAEETGSAVIERRAHFALGRARAERGEREAAARHLRRAIGLTKDAWFELRAGAREAFLATAEARDLERTARALVEAEERAAAPAAGGEPSSGLVTHARFLARLDAEIEQARGAGRSLAILRVRIEGLRLAADIAGSEAACALIERVGALIVENLREHDLCARTVADEFQVLLLDAGREGAELTAERLARAIEAERFQAGSAPIELSPAIGAAVFPDDAADRAGLFARADEALAAAKGAPRPSAPPGIEALLFTREGRTVLGILDRLVASDLDLDRLLDLACGVVCDSTRAERGFVMLREPDGRLVIRAGKGFDPNEDLRDQARVSTGIAERVAREREPVLVAEATEDDRFKGLRSVMELKLRSIVCAPLIVKEGEEPIGVLYVDHNSIARQFTRADLNLLVAIAKKIAPIIASSKRLREKEEELESVRARLLKGGEKERAETKYSYDKIIGRSAAMQRVFQLLDRVVDTQHPVVIYGESGTGKELVARAIHYNGPRKLRPFVAENCAALSETLLEAELFGHTKGAFTGADRDSKGLFELASGGTLFLDEIGDMSERMQQKLLRVLQEGEVRPVGGKRVIQVDVRVISASNKDLRKLIEKGQFREDLYYRLSVITVALPPLRERKEDIPLLVEHFLKKAAREKPPKKVDREVLRLFLDYDWPGNVRELENEVLRMVAMSDDVVGPDAVSPKLREGRERRAAPAAPSLAERFRGKTLREIEEEVVREVILKTLEETNWHRSQTAQLLGLPTSTLFNKMRKLGIG